MAAVDKTTSTAIGKMMNGVGFKSISINLSFNQAIYTTPDHIETELRIFLDKLPLAAGMRDLAKVRVQALRKAEILLGKEQV
jgi:hypothetical protein